MLFGFSVALNRMESHFRKNRSALLGGGKVARKAEGGSGLFRSSENGGAGLLGVLGNSGEFHALQIWELGDCGIPYDGGINGAETQVACDLGDGGFGNRGALGERWVSRSEKLSSESPDGGGFGIGDRKADPVALEFNHRAELSWVFFANGKNRTLLEDWKDFAEEAKSFTVFDGSGVSCNEDVSRLDGADGTQQRACPTVLDVDFIPRLRGELGGDRLDGFFEGGRAVDDEGSRFLCRIRGGPSEDDEPRGEEQQKSWE